MAVVKGRGIAFEFAATYGTAINVTAVTLANPAVATATAHGQANNTVGYFNNVSGMVQLEGQAVRVKNQATNTFELQGLNTTAYSAFTAGQFIPVATWHTLAEATSYSIGGGEAEKLDATTLIDVVKQEEAGLLAPQSLTLNILAQDTPSTAMAALQSLAQSGAKMVFRVRLPNGAVRIGYGEPSLPGEDVQRGQLGTGTLSVTLKGVVLQLAP
jgi:hypothetical protein